MKKVILTVIMTFCLSFIGFSQNTITFKGIPVTGSIDNFCKSLEQKGFEKMELTDNPYLYFGEFNGVPVAIMPQTMSGKVWRVMILDYNTRNKTSIISRFNELFNQFINNPNYKTDHNIKGAVFLAGIPKTGNYRKLEGPKTGYDH